MVDRKSSAGSGSRVRLSPVGGANSLSPGDYDTRRRLSAPCSTASNGSQISPTSPVHRSTSPSPVPSNKDHGKMSSEAWVCPNDRQLALRAKLQSGWSAKTATLNHWKQPDPLSNGEQEKIVSVIQRAEELERVEKARLQRLLERLENMRRNAAGDGDNTCILCGEGFGFFTRQKNLMCFDCKKSVCTRCGVESQGTGKEGTIWLCKICSETREVWKKSGAWFFKGMPIQEIIGMDEIIESSPPKMTYSRRFTVYKPTRRPVKDEVDNVDHEDVSSEEEGDLSKRTFNFHKDKMDGAGSDGSCQFSMQSNYSSMESLACSDPGLYNKTEQSPRPRPNLPLPLRGHPPHHHNRPVPPPISRCGSPVHFRPRPPVPRPNRPPGPPWNMRPPFPPPTRGPRPPPPLGSPRGSPRGGPRGRYPSGPRIRTSRPMSCPRVGDNQASSLMPPIEQREVTPGKESSSPSDNDLTEVPLSTSIDGKTKRGSADGVISTLRRLSTVNRKSRSKKKIQDFDFEDESDLNRSPIRRDKDGKSDETNSSSPRTPDGSAGTLEFALIYDETNNLLLVNILRAKGLKGLDMNGLCDSYCKITLVPQQPKVSQQRTRTVNKNVNPEYTSLLHFPNIGKDQLSSLHMLINILDEDISGDHLLAEARVGLIKIFPQMQKQFQVCLHRPVFQPGFDGVVVPNDSGRIELSISFYSQHGTLKVCVIGCKGLSPQNESVNPYVRVVLLPLTNQENKRKTTMKWKTCDPEYNEQFVFLTNITDLPKQSLTVTVWSHEKDANEEYLGGIVLGLSSKGERLKHWASVIKHPNRVHKRTHTLCSNFLE